LARVWRQWKRRYHFRNVNKSPGNSCLCLNHPENVDRSISNPEINGEKSKDNCIENAILTQ
jgi:hypothetical protein